MNKTLLQSTFLSAAVTAATFAVSATAVSAQELNYNYLQGSYSQQEVDGGLEADGLGIAGSFAISTPIYLTASIAEAEFDNAPVDVRTYSAGIGYRIELAPGSDLNLESRLIRSEIESNAFSFDDSENGYGLALAVRHLVTDQFELGGGLDYSDFGDGGDETALSVGALYHISPIFSVGAGYSTARDTDGWSAGIRLNF